MRRAALLLTAALSMAACQREPRSASYFETHLDEARKVLEACRTGAQRGRECETAKAGIAAANADKRMDLFKKSFE